jgi:DNA repair exonuclease SbcCD nuclease subunit
MPPKKETKMFYRSKEEKVSFVVTGDIHLNLNRLTEFERDRFISYFDILREEAILLREEGKIPILVLNGDIFDRSKPTYEEIGLFYEQVGIVSEVYDEVFIITGNHEELGGKKSLYNYIPEHGYKYIKVGSYVLGEVTVWMVGHTHLDIIPKVEPKNVKNILLSHYRSDIGFAKEEVHNDYVESAYDYSILSDIHYKFFPRENIEYTSSPYSITFSKEDFIGGYNVLTVHNNDFVVETRDVYLPNKLKINIDASIFKATRTSLMVITLERYVRNIVTFAERGSPDKLTPHKYKIEITNYPNISSKDTIIKSLLEKFPNIVGGKVNIVDATGEDPIESLVDDITERSDEGIYNTINKILENKGMDVNVIHKYSDLLRSL